MNLRLSSASSSQDKGLSYAFRYIYPIDVEDTVPFPKTFPFASRQVDCTFNFAVDVFFLLACPPGQQISTSFLLGSVQGRLCTFRLNGVGRDLTLVTPQTTADTLPRHDALRQYRKMDV